MEPSYCSFEPNDYVLRHAARRLKTLLRFYGADGAVTRYDNLRDFSDDLYAPALILHLPKNVGCQPCLVGLAGLFGYMVFRYETGVLLLGPLRPEGSLSGLKIEDWTLLGLAEEHAPDKEWLRHIPLCSLDALMDSALLIANHMPGAPELSRMQLEAASLGLPSLNQDLQLSLTKVIFTSLEHSFVHNPYNHEARECDAIERGDEEELRRILAEDFTGRYGTLSEDPIRQWVHLGIVAITLASRAAIRGGLHPETAFYLSDISIQRLDKCTDIPRLRHIYLEAELQYARLVHEIQKNQHKGKVAAQNEHISHTMDYIYSHIYNRITVQEIADSIGLEANYLSALFHQYTSTTIKQYILQEKVKRIQSLLVYSDESYIEIAANLGFASQSHMGQAFKRVTGLTPSHYRQRYRKDDFMEEHKPG
ncbi:MAG: AraC family transcriptional regulator [Eubacteriales bacterium]|nr:AraC family transcriptional regulator [Eubacteriales bacterium]